MRVAITIDRRPEIADPEGVTVLRALHELGFDEVSSVRMDRVIHLEVTGDDTTHIESRVAEMCDQLLANPVLEDYEIEISP